MSQQGDDQAVGGDQLAGARTSQNMSRSISIYTTMLELHRTAQTI